MKKCHNVYYGNTYKDPQKRELTISGESLLSATLAPYRSSLLGYAWFTFINENDSWMTVNVSKMKYFMWLRLGDELTYVYKGLWLIFIDHLRLIDNSVPARFTTFIASFTIISCSLVLLFSKVTNSRHEQKFANMSHMSEWFFKKMDGSIWFAIHLSTFVICNGWLSP